MGKRSKRKALRKRPANKRLRCEDVSPVDSLPLEVLILIFEKLPVHTLSCVIPKVCSRWRDIVASPLLWKNIIVKLDRFQSRCPQQPQNLFMAVPNIQNIQIGRNFSHEELHKTLSSLAVHCSKIRRFHSRAYVTWNHVFLINSDVVELLLPALPKRDRMPYFPYFRFLKRLYIHETTDVTFERIAPYLPKFCEVSVDILRVVGTVDIRQIHFASQVDFTKVDLKPETVNCLKKQPHIGIIDNSPTSSRLTSYASLPLRSISLTESYSSPVLTPTALIEFFRLQTFELLREISLERSRLDDAGALAIRSNCPQIRKIDISIEPVQIEKHDLTEHGILHLLHLPLMEVLFVRFRYRSDWLYELQNIAFRKCIGYSDSHLKSYNDLSLKTSKSKSLVDNTCSYLSHCRYVPLHNVTFHFYMVNSHKFIFLGGQIGQHTNVMNHKNVLWGLTECFKIGLKS